MYLNRKSILYVYYLLVYISLYVLLGISNGEVHIFGELLAVRCQANTHKGNLKAVNSKDISSPANLFL